MHDYSAVNANFSRQPREVWEDLREHMFARLTKLPELDGLRDCFDRQLLFAQFAWSGSSAAGGAARSNTTEITQKLAKDLEPLFESRGIQLLFDQFGSHQCPLRGPQMSLALWCLLVDKATRKKTFSTIEVSLGSCSGGFEIEIGDNHQLAADAEYEGIKSLDFPVKEMIDILLPSAELNWLKCPQGGHVTHMRVPLSASRIAA